MDNQFEPVRMAWLNDIALFKRGKRLFTVEKGHAIIETFETETAAEAVDNFNQRNLYVMLKEEARREEAIKNSQKGKREEVI